MRPAVHASFLRNRGLHHKRRKRTHVFSPLRLVTLLVSGVLLFIPGLALTIVGLQNLERTDLNEVQKVMYHAAGPVMGCVGIVLMFASCIYFNCYGTVPQTSAPMSNQEQILTKQQSLPDQDQDEKGSIRSKQRDPAQLQKQQVYNQHHNGRSVEVYTPDSKHSSRDDLSGSMIKSPHRTSATTEEDVPLAKLDDTTILTAGM
ncbi:hypothetical protein BsWGS_20915 [Bradybaena similaris]